MPKIIRLGLAGCGNYGRNLARFVGKVEGLQLTAAADTDPAALAALRSQGCEAAHYDTYERMLDEAALDAVIIATPNDLHADQAIVAMGRGLAVYLEKPVALTAEDCARVLETQVETGAMVMLGMQLRYGEAFRRAKELLAGGVVGQPRLIWYREFRGPFIAGAGGWRISNERSGGAIVEKCVHHFDLFNWYMDDEPVSVYASGGADVVYTGQGLIDNTIVTVNYPGGRRAALGLTLFSTGSDRELDFQIAGDRGVLSVFMDRLVLVENSGGQRSEIPVEQPYSDMGHGGTEYSALSAFYRMVAGGEPPLTGVREGIISTGMALAAQMSAGRICPVSLCEIIG